MRALIIKQDAMMENEAFWFVMNEIKASLIKEVSAIQHDSGYATRRYNKTIRLLLLVDIPWPDEVTNWHSVKEENLIYFRDIVESFYMNEEVIRGVLKLMYGIGSNYFKQGVSLISRILELSEGLKNTEVKSDTVKYVELVVRKYASQCRGDIRTIQRKKEEFLVILNWLVGLESVVGYFIRDEIL